MDFKQGGQVIQTARKQRGLTQEQLAERTDVAANSISRIERGLLVPSLSTLIDICNTLEIGADLVLADYISVNTPIRWASLSERFENMDLDKQLKIQTILNCLIDTI